MGLIGVLFWFMLAPVVGAFATGYFVGYYRIRAKFYRANGRNDNRAT